MRSSAPSDGRRFPTIRQTYSHSIINEPSKLLICKANAAAPQTFTVILTVKV